MKILKKYMKNSIPILILVVLTFIFFAKLFYPHRSIISTSEIGISDIWHFNFPLKETLGKALKQNTFPIWSRNMSGGFPILAESQIGAFNLYNILAFKYLTTIDAYNGGYIVSFLLCAIGMYLFSRRQQFSSVVSLYISIIYTFSGFFVTHMSHFVLLQSVCYLPIILYAVDLILTGNKDVGIILTVFFLSQQIFSGFWQAVFLTLLAVFAYAAYRLYTKETQIRRVLYLCFSVVFGILISAAQLFPTFELVRLSQRSGGLDAQELTWFKYPLKHFLSFVQPFVFGNPQVGSYPHFNAFNGSLFWENTGYIGLLPLFIVCISLLKLRKIRDGVFYLFMMIVSAIFMVGGDGPLYILLTLPPFSFFRFSSRYLLLFVFFLCLLVGRGFVTIDAYCRRKTGIVRTFPWFIIALSILNIGYVWFWYHPTVPYADFQKEPAIIEYFRTLPHGNIYSYIAHGRWFNEYTKNGSAFPKRYLELRNDLIPNSNLLYDLPETMFYAALYPRRLGFFASLFENSYILESTSGATLNSTLLTVASMRNTTHITSPIELMNTDLKLVHSIPLSSFDTKQYVYIYENKKALPKYYVVNTFRNVNTVEELLSKLKSESFDIASEVTIETPHMQFPTNTEVSYEIIPQIEHDTYVKLRTQSNTEGILAIALTYYPGWNAFIDGNKVTAFPVNLVNMGVDLPKGTHSVELKYEPDSIRYGITITLIGYAMLSLYCLIGLYRLVRRIT
jgi:hypothetical protein